MPDVTLPEGVIRGIELEGYCLWRSVPYGRPPIDDLRWRAPQPPEPWTGIRQATESAPKPWQPTKPGAKVPMSEDCLHLNICAPEGPPPSGGWPVLFFIHGGGDVTGSEDDLGVGEVFARAGIVVVKPDYRLGAFGFLNIATALNLPDEIDAGACGLLDQIAALRWTHERIPAFGGNPSQITIYGESAGAKAIGNLLGSPMTKGLFSQAISSSGGADDVAQPAASAQVARIFLTHLGISDPAKLRMIPASEILEAQNALGTGVHGTWIWRASLHPQAAPIVPMESIRSGNASGVRLLVGNNSNEAALFAYQSSLDDCIAPARNVLGGILGEQRLNQLLTTYQRDRGVDEGHALLAGMGDERYAISTLRVADAQAVHGTVYRYRLDAAPPGIPDTLTGAHGTDLFMVWQLPKMLAALQENAPRQRLATAVHNAWVSFIKTGVPVAEGLPNWPEYDAEQRLTMVFNDASRIESDPRKAERLIWSNTKWQYGTWFPLHDPFGDKG